MTAFEVTRFDGYMLHTTANVCESAYYLDLGFRVDTRHPLLRKSTSFGSFGCSVWGLELMVQESPRL